MIRFALSEDPRSFAYLDSLGWVLYKQGYFEKAAHYLRWALRTSRCDYPILYDDLDSTLFFVSEAIRVSDREDPVIHDHLADALYRMGRRSEARTHWEKALALSDPERDPPSDREHHRLHVKIRAKLKQLTDGESVTTADVIGPATTQPSPGTDDPKPPDP